jgi:hypothetical protein
VIHTKILLLIGFTIVSYKISLAQDVILQPIEKSVSCDSSAPALEIKKSIDFYSKYNYKPFLWGSTECISTFENRFNVKLIGGKSYLIIFRTEKYIDQSSICVLNNYNTVVQSAFKETGIERHSVMLQYNPIVSGTYGMILKTVDFSGRTVCGAWMIFER